MSEKLIGNGSGRDATSQFPLKVSYAVDVLIQAAEELIAFGRRYQEATSQRPGLIDAGTRFPSDFIDHLASRTASLKEIEAQFAAMVGIEPVPQKLKREGRHLLGELTALVAWYEATEENNVGILHSIARVEAANINDLDSPHSLAYALYNYATVANDILETDGPAGGITQETTKRAFELISQLIDAGRSNTTPSEEMLSLAALRRRLSHALQKNIGQLMSTIRFVFRQYPEIIREAEGRTQADDRVTSIQTYRDNPRFSPRSHLSKEISSQPQ